MLKYRAWVFQELVLAPRTIYFASQQLHWECISTRACETFPGSYEKGTLTTPGLPASIWDSSRSSIAFKWSGIVDHYSYGRVTFRKDKLVALSGVARRFARKFGTTYVAGMWKEELLNQLLWKTMDSYTESSFATETSIPSWSWASVDVGVHVPSSYEFEQFRPLVSILEATAKPVDDIFGDVEGGAIRMMGKLPILAMIVEDSSLQSCYIISIAARRRHIIMLHADRRKLAVGEDLYLLPLFGAYDLLFKDIAMEMGETIRGLVIEQVGQGSYRRTGCFESFEIVDAPVILKAQKEASYEDKYFSGEALGPDEEGHKMCIITLI